MSKSKRQGTSIRYSEAFKLQVIEQIENGRYTQNQAARVYRCSQSTIHGWLKSYGRNHLLNKIVRVETMNETDRIKQLEKQVKELKSHLADAYVDKKISQSYFELACRELGIDPDEFKKKRIHQAIQVSCKQDPAMRVTHSCKRLGVSRQAYYQYQKRARVRHDRHQRILELVRAERGKNPRLGTRKLYHKLKPMLQAGELKIGRDGLFELLRSHRMLVEPRRRGPRTTDGAATWWKNILAEAHITGPNQAWVADISYLYTLGGHCYMALISDAYSRKIIGWDVSESLELEGALRALHMALKDLPEGARPIHHSDRGSQYRSKAYTKRLQQQGCLISMTEKDHCAENAQAERINGILKGEYYLDVVFNDTKQARKAVEMAIKMYNHQRPHLSLNYQVPEVVHRAA